MSHGFIELNIDVEPGKTMAIALQIVHLVSVEQLPEGGCEVVDRTGGEYVVINSYGDVMSRIRAARETRMLGRPPSAPAPATV